MLIEVGENLLPTVYLPELDELKQELVRAYSVLESLNQVSSRMIGVSDHHMTELIYKSETLVIDLNKPILQAVLHTQQLRRLATV